MSCYDLRYIADAASNIANGRHVNQQLILLPISSVADIAGKRAYVNSVYTNMFFCKAWDRVQVRNT